MTELDITESKIPLWVLCGIGGKPEWEGGKLVPGSARFYLFGFYLDKEYCEMAKECLEKEHRFKDSRIWIIETEANHMWIWDITEGP